MQLNQAALDTPVSGLVPAITWLNMSGDVTITWDDSNRDSIKELVSQKMTEGYSFFILTPRALSVFGNKKVALTDSRQLDNALGVVVADSQVAAIVANLGDPAVESVVRSGKATRAVAPKLPLDCARRAESAAEVVQNQTVAVRRVVGG